MAIKILVIGKTMNVAKMKLNLLRKKTHYTVETITPVSFVAGGKRYIATTANESLRGFKPDFVYIDANIPNNILQHIIFPMVPYPENRVFYNMEEEYIDLQKEWIEQEIIKKEIEKMNKNSQIGLTMGISLGNFELGKSSKLPKTPKHLLKQMGIERVIFNEDATIVFLTTGEKGVAIRSSDDEFDPVIGLSVAYAIAKGTRGSKSKYKELVAKLHKNKRGGV